MGVVCVHGLFGILCNDIIMKLTMKSACVGYIDDGIPVDVGVNRSIAVDSMVVKRIERLVSKNTRLHNCA